jgi:CBS domain-containing protein
MADKHWSQIRVSALNAKDPVVVAPDDPLGEVAQILAAYDVRGVPVVDSTGELVGVVSQTDLVRRWASTITDWHNVPVRDVMTAPALTIDPAATFKEAAELMTRRSVARLVLIDATSGMVLGVLSDSDLVRAVAL